MCTAATKAGNQESTISLLLTPGTAHPQFWSQVEEIAALKHPASIVHWAQSKYSRSGAPRLMPHVFCLSFWPLVLRRR
jgi:hypothetical protein